MKTLQIKEVDCYIGNALATKYATTRAVQHQILLEGQPIGRLNSIADSDRGERIVLNKWVNTTYVDLFEKIKSIRNEMKQEQCSSIEEYNAAVEYNENYKKKIDDLVFQMWQIESLNLPLDIYREILLY
jgi:hypothetical protein